MHSLDQLGPRIPLESVAQPGGGYSIAAPGSYFASKMLNGGITVAASNVTIDFNGFGVVGTSAPTVAVNVNLVAPRSNLKICNGSISGPSVTVVQGTGGAPLSQLELVDLRVSSTDGSGAVVDEQTALTNPTATRVIFSSLSRGLDFGSGGSIIECNASNLTMSGNNGFRAMLVSHSSIQNSTFDSNSEHALISGGTVSHCQLRGITANGLVIGIQAQTATNCSIDDLGQAGTVSTLFGIVGNVIQGCSVNRLTVTSGSGFAVGIFGNVVDACSVVEISGAGSVYGISGTMSPATGVVSKCTVREVHCLAATTGSNVNCGISAPTVVDCNVDSIYAGPASIAGISGDNVRGCKIGRMFGGDSNSSAGIISGSQFSGAPSFVADCTVATGGADFGGIVAKQPGLIRGCTISSLGGVMVNSGGVTVDGCTISGVQYGIAVSVDSTSNLVIRNHVTGTMFPFFAGANVRVGPVVSGAGGVIANTNPWANFAD